MFLQIYIYIYICNNTLKVSKYCDFVEHIKEWFSVRHSIYGKNGAIKYITHLDKFSYFPKHYNFHEIMLYSQCPSENFQVEICVLSNNLKIF